MNQLYETYVGPSIKTVEPSMPPELHEAFERARARNQNKRPIYGLSTALFEVAKPVTVTHPAETPPP